MRGDILVYSRFYHRHHPVPACVVREVSKLYVYSGLTRIYDSVTGHAEVRLVSVGTIGRFRTILDLLLAGF